MKSLFVRFARKRDSEVQDPIKPFCKLLFKLIFRSEIQEVNYHPLKIILSPNEIQLIRKEGCTFELNVFQKTKLLFRF